MCINSGTIAKAVCAPWVLVAGWDESRTFGGTDGKFLVTGGKRGGKFQEELKFLPPALGDRLLDESNSKKLTLLGKKLEKKNKQTKNQNRATVCIVRVIFHVLVPIINV